MKMVKKKFNNKLFKVSCAIIIASQKEFPNYYDVKHNWEILVKVHTCTIPHVTYVSYSSHIIVLYINTKNSNFFNDFKMYKKLYLMILKKVFKI